jgi:probable phosphoglycerate mutase
VLVFGHGHCLSVIGARWAGLPVVKACVLLLSTGSLSIVGCDHTAEEPVVRLWNDDRHVASDA